MVRFSFLGPTAAEQISAERSAIESQLVESMIRRLGYSLDQVTLWVSGVPTLQYGGTDIVPLSRWAAGTVITTSSRHGSHLTRPCRISSRYIDPRPVRLSRIFKVWRSQPTTSSTRWSLELERRMTMVGLATIRAQPSVEHLAGCLANGRRSKMPTRMILPTF